MVPQSAALGVISPVGPRTKEQLQSTQTCEIRADRDSCGALLVKRVRAPRIGDEHETARSALGCQSTRSLLELGAASSLAAVDCRRATNGTG